MIITSYNHIWKTGRASGGEFETEDAATAGNWLTKWIWKQLLYLAGFEVGSREDDEC